MTDEALSRDLPLGPRERAAPRPAGPLLASVNHLQPVRTRRPIKTFLFVAAAAIVYPIYAFSQFPLRADLAALPWTWFIPVALLWLAGFILPLVLALLPRRGHVLPNEGSAGRAAVIVAVVLTAVGFFTVDAPGHTIIPGTRAEAMGWLWHCLSFNMRIVMPVLIVGTVALARVMLVGAARLGAAVGAAGGALTGLTLHGLCPVGGAFHVVAAHGGAVVTGTILGALVFPLVRRLVERFQPTR
jgi:hypothetical protein